MMAFTPGDLVEFDVKEEGDMRIALRPSVVAQGHYETLTSDLIHATKRPNNETRGHVTGEMHSASCVLPFPEIAGRCSCDNAPETARGLKAS